MTHSPRLKEIEERTNAATKGPWLEEYLFEVSVESDEFREDGDEVHDGFESICLVENSNFGDDQNYFNTSFIAHSREDIPWLISQIRDLEGRLGVAEEALEDISQNSGMALTKSGIKDLNIGPGVEYLLRRFSEISKEALAKIREGGE